MASANADTKSNTSVKSKSKSKPKADLVPMIVQSLFDQPESWDGRLFNTVQVYIELGRRQVMWLSAAGKAHDQITIREIRIHPELQRKGIFKAIVKRILEMTGGVQLEAIENEWLLAAVDKSPLWKPQCEYSRGELYTTYSRVGKPDPNTPFVLF